MPRLTPRRASLIASLLALLALSACTSPQSDSTTPPRAAFTYDIIVRNEPIPEIALSPKAFIRNIYYEGPLVFVNYALKEEHHEIYSTDTRETIAFASPIAYIDHAGTSFFAITADNSPSKLYQARDGTLTQILELSQIIAVAASPSHIATLRNDGVLTVYELHGATPVPLTTTNLDIANDKGIYPPTITWIAPHDLLAVTPDKGAPTTIIYTKNLVKLATIAGTLTVSNCSLNPGIIPLANAQRDAIDLVQVNAIGHELARIPIPGKPITVYLPSPDATKAVVTYRGFFKGSSHKILTVDTSRTKPRIKMSGTLAEWPVGWRPIPTP